MKPLNPILNQILQERFQVSALKPPRIRPPHLEAPRARPIGEVPAWKPVEIEPVAGGTPKVKVNFDVYPQTPRSTIIDIITATEKQNPALVKQVDYQKLGDYLNMEVELAIQRTGSTNYDDLWREVTKANPKIIDSRSETVQDALDDIITFKIQPPTKFETSTEVSSEMEPKEKELSPKVQAMPTQDEIANVQPEQTIGSSVQSAIPALLPIMLPALQTAPIRKTNNRLRTRTKTAPERDYEEVEEVGPTATEIQRQKEIEAELERPFRFDPDEPALELEKNLGKYGGTYVRR